MLTLAIDTSTNILSVALMSGNEVLASINEQTKNNQSEILMSRIEMMMNECSVKPTDLERIAVATGPGSYTGIRVGVAAAKSLAYALDIPVIGVSSLEVMAHAANDVCLIVPMIDARRATVFAGVYERDVNLIPDGHYKIEELLDKLNLELFESDRVTFIGDGAIAHKERLLTIHEYADVLSETDLEYNKAEVLAKLASDALPIENVHALLPNYLRKTEAELNAGV